MVHADDYGERDREDCTPLEGMRFRRFSDGRWLAILNEDDRVWWIADSLAEVVAKVRELEVAWKGVA